MLQTPLSYDMRATLEEKISSAERALCREAWGFDPVIACIRGEQDGQFSLRYRYEAWFPLTDLRSGDDPVEMGARVDFAFPESIRFKENLFVRCGAVESPVACARLVVIIPPEVRTRSTHISEPDGFLEGYVAGQLHPWDRFGALCSIAGGIAELGIAGVLSVRSFFGINDPEALPPSFGARIQRAFILALRKVLAGMHQSEGIEVQRAAFAVIDSIIERLVSRLAKTSSPEWFFERLGTLDTIYCAGITERDVEHRSFLRDNLGDKEALPDTPEEFQAFRKEISLDPVWEEEEAEGLDYDLKRGPGFDVTGSQAGQPENYGSPILHALLQDPVIFGRLIAAPKSRFLKVLAVRWLETAPDVLALLARDPDPKIRRAVARHPQTPSNILEELLADAETIVRDEAKVNLHQESHAQS